MKDYDAVYQMWKRTPGVGLRTLDDSREGIEKFLKRNPNTNFIAIEEEHIIGVALSGHDGRRGFLYHTCVDERYRQKSIGSQLIDHVKMAMKEENITKLALVCFSDNRLGNHFWNKLGWIRRSDLNYYTISINESNE
jgi:ribosomal protein S18 acetylase RimI-like enzyme